MPSITTTTMSIEKGLRIFRKKCENAGIKDRIRELEFYEKPTAKRKRKLKSAVKRQERERCKEQSYSNDYRKSFKRRK